MPGVVIQTQKMTTEARSITASGVRAKRSRGSLDLA